MLKGLSTIIVIVLLVLIVITLVFLFWLFASSLFTVTSATGKTSVENVTYRLIGCIRIIDVNRLSGTLVLRNCGTVQVGNCNVFVDGSEILSDSRTLDPNSILSIPLSLPVGKHDIFVVCDNAQSDHRTVNIVGGLAPQWYNSYINSTIAGTAVLHSLEWTSSDGLSGYIFSFDNCIGTFVNDSNWVSMTGTEDWSNVTKTISSTISCTVRWMVYANDTHNRWSASPMFSYLTNGGGGSGCGNGICENGENCSTCQSDCGTCGSVCGNGVCENGENQYNCPQDCGAPPSCDFHITSLTDTYTINQNNKIYCLENNVHIDGKNAIVLPSSVQNTILNCLGNNIDGNKTSNTYGVELAGSNTLNNTVKNCNVTNFYYGIYLNSVNNTTIDSNTVSGNSVKGIALSFQSQNNILTNNIANGNNMYGISLDSVSQNNILNNNTANGNLYIGIILFQTKNNILTNNIANYNNSWYGIAIAGFSSNNTLINNIVNGNTVGIAVQDSSNNTISGGSIYNNTIDYYINGTLNNFTSTNFTAKRIIYFKDTISWFNYNNESTGNTWLKTRVSVTPVNITRKLFNWNNALIQWNDTFTNSSGSITASYNITGLLTNVNYNVYNTSALIYTLPSGPNGEVDFTIYLSSNQEQNITVQKV